MTKPALHLGTLQSVKKSRLDAVMGALEDAIELTVGIGHSKDLSEDVVQGKYDAVFAIDGQDAPGVTRLNAIAEDVILIAPLGWERWQTPQDLAGKSFQTLDEGCAYRKRVCAWLDDAGVEVNVVPNANYAAIIDAVIAGKGFGMLPGSLFAGSDKKDQFQAKPIEGENGKVWVELIWNDKANAQAIEALRTLLAI